MNIPAMMSRGEVLTQQYLRLPTTFPTLRRCPECRREMVTDGEGRFFCLGCGYHDRQDIRKLRRLAGRTTGRRGLRAWDRDIRSQAEMAAAGKRREA
ncbi:MAG: hypothetical protein SVR04_00210 [Spirochaetota bacterium]|jgi:hypothetical protein|nr:hypothetical protein [Spirochaetota bacterium]